MDEGAFLSAAAEHGVAALLHSNLVEGVPGWRAPLAWLYLRRIASGLRRSGG